MSGPDWTALTCLFTTGAHVQRGKYLDTPLHAAAQKDCTAMVKMLLDFGADINARNLEFQKPVEVSPPGSSTESFLMLYEGELPRTATLNIWG